MKIAQSDIDYLKSQIDFRTIVQQDLGKPHGTSRNPMLFHSPFRGGDKEPSFAAYHDHGFDYGDPSKGSIDHIQYLSERLGMSFKDALEHLRKIVGAPEFVPIADQVSRSHSSTSSRISPKQAAFYASNLPIVGDYLEERAISYGTAALNGVGGEAYTRRYITIDKHLYEFPCRRLVIPCIVGSEVLSIEFRRDELSVREYVDAHPSMVDMVRIDQAKKRRVDPSDISTDDVLTVMFCRRYHRPTHVNPHVFGLNNVVTPTEPKRYKPKRIPWVMFAEGGIDALSAQSVGFNTCLGYKANNNIDIQRITSGARMKFIMQDNDKDKQRPNGQWYNPGYDNAIRLFEQLGGDETIRIIRIPDPYKDLNDMIRAGVLKDFLSQKQFRILVSEIDF